MIHLASLERNHRTAIQTLSVLPLHRFPPAQIRFTYPLHLFFEMQLFPYILSIFTPLGYGVFIVLLVFTSHRNRRHTITNMFNLHG